MAASADIAVNLTSSSVGIISVIVFVIAYAFVMAEEVTHLRKSKPVILSAGIIWALIAFHFMGDKEMAHMVEASLRHGVLEYAELFLFLLVAMTYINSMDNRDVFNALRSWLTRKGFTYKQLFVITGVIAFFLSPIADNLTTALVLCAVLLAVGKDNNKFISIGCINIVVAANAGGAFSPFGDITTLMVWQKGLLNFFDFFAIFIPSVVNYVVPAFIMYFFVENGTPKSSGETVVMRRGAKRIIFLFILTIVTAVCFHNFLTLPPMLGMMVGFGYLSIFGYYLKMTHGNSEIDSLEKFDVLRKVSKAEWDTLLFFFGVILSVGGLGFIGYLSMINNFMYVELGATWANVLVGILSAIVDNIPVMFAVLTMNPPMEESQWLLVTLTAGVGGSMLSVGSAAGVALMGQARGKYTFFGHLKWTPVIALGYAASIYTHILINF